jgi:hypothetical protein
LFFEKHLVIKEKPVADTKTSEKFTVDIETLKSYVGKYKASSIGLVIDYKLEKGKLVAYPTGQSALPLDPTSKATFNYDGVEATIVFKLDDDGKSIGAMHKQGGKEFQMEKLLPFNPSPNVLKTYEGKYFCEELETFYTVIVKDTVMYATHRNLKDIAFSPVENDVFKGDIYFMRNVVFKRDTKGIVNAFSVSNGRTKGVHFKKQ